MKRQDKKQRQKIKNMDALKWIKRAKNMCVFLVVAFLIYVFVVAQVLNEDYAQVVANYPVINIGFVIATANLFIWYIIKKIIGYLEQYENIELSRMVLIVITIAQCFLLNYISVILLIIGLKKFFNWNEFRLPQQFKVIKQQSKLTSMLGVGAVLCLFIALTFTISLSIL